MHIRHSSVIIQLSIFITVNRGFSTTKLPTASEKFWNSVIRHSKHGYLIKTGIHRFPLVWINKYSICINSRQYSHINCRRPMPRDRSPFPPCYIFISLCRVKHIQTDQRNRVASREYDPDITGNTPITVTHRSNKYLIFTQLLHIYYERTTIRGHYVP